jgi:hypothetical protein
MLYFKQCIALLNDIKVNYNLEDNILTVIDETETECSKLLTVAIENNIEKPINKMDTSFNLDNSDNELFYIVDTGDLFKLKKFNFGELNFNIYNEDGLTPLHYAIRFGDTSFLKKAFTIGGLIDQTNSHNHTLFEFACLEKDPNMIDFLCSYGASMSKHLKFRECKKYVNNGNSIDIALLEKKLLDTNLLTNKLIEKPIQYFEEWILKYINMDEAADISLPSKKMKLENKHIIAGINNFLNLLKPDIANNYIDIVKNELNYELQFKLVCPNRPLHILFYYLYPFIFDFANIAIIKNDEIIESISLNNNITLNWIVSGEIKYKISHVIKSSNKINIKELKDKLLKILYDEYIQTQILPEGLIQIIVLQLLAKFRI